MEKSQREVTDKIRNAIKHKLKEMNVFVDDELPDYIMILVANKRSKHHMENDLSLFLGNETAGFTNWLWDLVNNLKVGSKSKRSKQEMSDSKTPEVQVPDVKERSEEDDVLNYDPAEEGEFYQLMEGTEDTNEPASNQLMEMNKIKSSASKIIPPATPETEAIVLSHPTAVKEVTNNKDEHVKKSEEKKVYKSSSPIKNSALPLKTVQKSAKVYPVQRVEKASAPACELPAKPEHAGNVSSVVCVTQRKYGGPAALQANKLLLRAVSDAAKSVLDGKDINDYYKPVKDLSSDSTETYHMEDSKPVCEKSKTLINIKINKDKGGVVPARQVIKFKTDPSELNEVSEDSFPNSPTLQPTHYSEHDQAPHFIVTLDGINSSSLKRRHSSAEEMEVDDNSSLEEPENSVPEKRQKLPEKCKYWPACKNKNCSYHHPTVLCTMFPNCKFGNKCFYLHPTCKFDSLCKKIDCPFTHLSRRVLPAKIPPSFKRVKPQSVKIMCKYYPKCLVKFCPFLHPKLCRFGIQCRIPKCALSHFHVPNQDRYKWKAQ